MNGLISNPQTSQLVPVERAQTVTLISDVESWVAHFVGGRDGHNRCAGRRCAICARGKSPKKRRAFVLCVDQLNNERWLALGIRTQELEAYPSAVGLIVKVSKEGPRRNDAIEIKVIGQDHTIEGKSAKAFFSKWDPMAGEAIFGTAGVDEESPQLAVAQ